MQQNDTYFMGLCADSDEIDMFQCENLQELIAFKWQNYGFRVNLIGTVIHLAYIGLLFVYTYIEYVRILDNEHITFVFEIMIIGFVSYPIVYESM